MYFSILYFLVSYCKDASKWSQAVVSGMNKFINGMLGVIFGKKEVYRIAAIKIPVRIAMNFLMLNT